MTNNKIVSILSYFLIGVIWYFLDKKVQDKHTNFHVKQALNLIIISFGFSMLLNILSGILIVVTFGLFGYFAGILHLILQLFFLILAIIGIINVINNNKKELPYIGEFANKYLSFK